MKSQAKKIPQTFPAKVPKIMIVAGEESSDHHAASLAKAIRASSPEAEIFGMGGTHSRAAGIETIVDSETSASVMGLVEVVGNLGKLISAFNTLRKAALERDADLVIFVDFPDFNMLLARALSGARAKKLYFISPQLWAWRKGRVKSMKKLVDKVAPIFPFEEKFYLENGVDAEFVGHPFLDREEISLSKEEFFSSIGLDPQKPTLAILPGSRKAEIERLLAPLVGAYAKLKEELSELQAIIPIAENVERAEIEHATEDLGVTLVDGKAREVLNFSDAAVISSGTATVEAALARCPMVIVYKLAGFTYLVARKIVTGVKNFGMPNLILGERVLPELLQDEVTAENIVRELKPMLLDSEHNAKIREQLSCVSERLASKDSNGRTSSERAAEIAFQLIEEGANV